MPDFFAFNAQGQLYSFLQMQNRYRYKNLLADHTQGGKDNSFKQQPLAGVLSQAEIGKEGGVRVGLQGPQVVVSRHRIVATASAAPSSHYRAPPWMAMVGQLSSVAH